MASVIPFRVAGAALALLGFMTWLEGQLVPSVNLFEPVLAIGAAFALAALVGSRADIAGMRAKELLLRPSPRSFVIVSAVAAFTISAFLSWYSLDTQVWVMDEVTQRFQSRLLLGGRLWLVAEPMGEFFETRQTVVVDGRWFGEFPIGAPLLMAPGDLIRAPWLINPAMAALGTWGMYRFFSRISGEFTGRAVTVLFALTPFVLFVSASQMSHPKTLVAMLLALCGLWEWSTSDRDARRRAGALAVGTGVGLLAAIRPYDAVLVAVPIAVFQLFELRRVPRLWAYLPWQIGAAMVFVALVLWTNVQTTGSPFVFGYDVLNGPLHRPGFHMDPEGVPFTPYRGFFQLSIYLARFNSLLLEWPVPAIGIVALSLLLRRARPKAPTQRAAVRHGSRRSAVSHPADDGRGELADASMKWDYLVLGIAVAILGGYWAYWHLGDAFGPRFLYLAVPALLLYVVDMPANVEGAVRSPSIRRTAWLLPALCLVVAWLPIAGEWRKTGVWSRAAYYRSVLLPAFPKVGAQIADAGIDNALVLVREPWASRLGARLRRLGLTPFGADRVLSDLDACVLEEALAREDEIDSSTLDERLDRVIRAGMSAGRGVPDPRIPGANHLVFVPGLPLTERCVRELTEDARGTAPFMHFLPFNDFDSSGRLGRVGGRGGVIFARDLGDHNEALRARFDDRTWYRYRPFDSTVFEPY